MAEPLRVLILEALPSDAALLAQHLERAGFAVGAHQVDAVEGLGEVLTRGWDLVLCDVEFAGRSEAHSQCLQAGMDVPFILVTSGQPEPHERDLVPKADGARLAQLVKTRLGAHSGRGVSKPGPLNENDLRSLLEISPFAAVVFDEQGLPLYANRQFSELYGYRGQGPATIEDWWQLVYPQDDYRKRVLADWRAHLSAAPQNGSGMRPMDVVITRPDGAVRHVEIFAARLGGRLCIITVDLSERERAEAARRAGEERYRRFVQMSGEGVWRFDLLPPVPPDLPEDELVVQLFERAHVGECNDEFARQLGYSRAPDLLGRRLAELMQGAREEQLETFRCFVRGGFRVADLLTVQGRGVQSRWMVSSLVGIIEQESLVCIWGTRRDVTSQRQAQQALQRSEAEFRAVFDRAPVGIILVSPEGRILRVNSGLRDILGQADDEIGILHFADLTHPEDRERVRAAHAELSAGGRDWYQIETRFLRRDETVAWIDLVASGIRDENGKLVRAICVLHDITRRRLAEQEQIRHQQELTALNEIVTATTSTLDPRQILDSVLQSVRKMSRVDRTSIMLLDRESDLLETAAVAGPEGPMAAHLRLSRGQGAAGQVLREVKPLVITDVRRSPHYVTPQVDQQGGGLDEQKALGYVGFPLVSRGKVIGVLSLVTTKHRDFSAGEIAFFQAVCGAAAVSIENALIHQDIQRRAEKLAGEIALQKHYAENVVRSITDGVLTVDSKNRIVSWNRGAEGITGFTAEEAVGRLCHDVGQHFPSDGQPLCFTDWWPFAEIRRTLLPLNSREVSARHRDGRHLTVSISAAPLFDDKGEFQGVVTVFRDVSRERELIDGIQRADRAKSAFLASMSHEIRTPMNAILGFTQLLLRDSTLSPTQRQYLETIGRSSEHLQSLIDDVLEMSKIEAGRVSVNLASFDLRGTMADLAGMFRLRTEAKNLRFETKVDDGVPDHLVSDERKLRQILINLLGNAIKFTEQGFVAVRVWSESHEGAGARLMIDVEDSGPGIATADRERIFNPFEQAVAGTRAGGTGLGLAISRQFARLLGGDVTVTSEVGRGSCFHVVVAFGSSESAVTHEVSSASRIIGIKPSGAVPRILVVDDQLENRKLMSQILEAVGYEVREANDGAEAVNHFSEWKPHAILMDMLMPKVGGAEAIRQIRLLPEGPKTFILAVSASAFAENRQQALSAGADDFLSKPFHDSDLLERLRVRLGVEYISVSAAPGHTPTPMPAERAAPKILSARIPAGLREQLHTAALHADYDRLMSLANELADVDAEAARSLRQTVERFDYQQLIDDRPSGDDHA